MSSLTFAVPSKGRLKDKCIEYFGEAGFSLKSAAGARGYAGEIPEAPGIDLQFRSSSEIANLIIAGSVHLGVTGLDLLYEATADVERSAFLFMPLGFGHADLVVAAPGAWLDVETMADLDDVAAIMEARTGRRLRVATKYGRQTRAYFDQCGVGHYRTIESAGATEGLPAAGGAEVVVDITTTGATLEGNGLRILSDGLIRRSQAYLCASLRADWSAEALAELASLVRSLEAREVGRSRTILEFDPGFDPSGLDGAEFQVLEAGSLVCDSGDATRLAGRLTEMGAGPVRLAPRDFIYGFDSGQTEKFTAAIKGQ